MPHLSTLRLEGSFLNAGPTSTKCLALQRVADRIVGVQTGQGLIQAKQIVLAAGAWSWELASSVGIQLPLRMRVLQALLTTPAQPGVLQPVLSAVGRALSVKQLSDGTLLLGGGWSGDPNSDGRSYTLREESQRGNWATACELFPLVRNLDDLPFIGSFSGLDGLTLAPGS